MSEIVQTYAPIGVTILLVMATAGGMLAAAHLIGPRRHGPVKDSPYESGVPIITEARRRFNVRFYIVAVLFMLFDVEVVFLWPWALVYYQAATGGPVPANGDLATKGYLAAGMGVFFALLLFGLAYEWKKGALRWE